MVWSDDVTVFGVSANGREWTFVDDTFDLHDHRVEDVDVKRLATEDYFEVFLKKADNALPTSSVVTGVGGNKFPLQSSFSQYRPIIS